MYIYVYPLTLLPSVTHPTNHHQPKSPAHLPPHPPTQPHTNEKNQAVPVEEFGAALLRGMGWQGPSEDDVKVYQAAPRPQG